MPVKLSKLALAVKSLTQAIEGADTSKDGQVSRAEASKAGAGLAPEARGALKAVWSDAFDDEQEAPTPAALSTKLNRHADALKSADADGSKTLSRDELFFIDPPESKSLADYLRVLSNPAGWSDLAATAAVGQALSTSLGVKLKPEVYDVGGSAKRPVVLIRSSNGFAKVTLAPKGKQWQVANVKFTHRPTVVEVAFANKFADTLAKDFGLKNPRVLATGHFVPHAGTTYWHLLVRHGRPSRVEQIQLELSADGRALGSYRYNLGAFRDQALQVAVQASLDWVKTLPAPRNRIGELEVFLKRDRVTPGQIKRTSPAASPVPFDEKREVQVAVPALVGQRTIYVTIDRRTGMIRSAV